MEANVHIGASQFVWLALGVVISFIVPVAIAVVWKIKKKEPFTSVLAGAAAFLLFAIILEKPIQSLLIIPTSLGLKDHALSTFVNARPVLFSLLLGLFPGVFEETGRLITFKTVLRKRKNRETSISYGIGHGGFEMMYVFGMAYIQYIVYAVMINAGVFQSVIDQVAEVAPDQTAALYEVVNSLTAFSFADLGIGLVERAFAILFHIGASILVFYACRDRGKIWLYPLAIVLHTGMDFIAALSLLNVIKLPVWALEGIFALFALLTFAGAYFMLYKRDKLTRASYDQPAVPDGGSEPDAE